MFPTEASLMQTCGKFNDSQSKTGKKPEMAHRAQSGSLLVTASTTTSAYKTTSGRKQTKKPTSSEQHTKPILAPTPDRYQREIKEEEGEEEVKKEPDRAQASLGMGYFFGEGEVPKEVEDLLQRYQSFTHELEQNDAAGEIARMNKMPQEIAPDMEKPKTEGSTNLSSTSAKQLEDVPEYEDDFEAEPEAKPDDEPTYNPEVLGEAAEPEAAPQASDKDGYEVDYDAESNDKEEKKEPTAAPSKEEHAKKVIKKVDKCAASYDSATLDSAIGLLDLKLLCRCFAYAIHKHIVFSKGRALLSELDEQVKGQEPQNFAYKLNDMLKINIPIKTEGTAYNFKETPRIPTKHETAEEEEKDKVIQLGPEKYKQLISESFSALAGQYVPPDQLNSYLTLEGGEEDIDLSYTQTHLDEFLKSCNHSYFTISPNPHLSEGKRKRSQLECTNTKLQEIPKQLQILKSATRATPEISDS